MPERAHRLGLFALTDVLFPALVLRVLVLEPVAAAEAAALAGGMLVVVVAGAVAAAPFGRAAGLPYRAVVLPLAFMNSGFIGIPVCGAYAGAAGAAAAAVYDQTMTVVILTLGVSLVGGSARAGLVETLRAPFSWAVVAGLAWGSAGWPFPRPLDLACRAMGAAALPTAIFLVVHDVARIEGGPWRLAAAGAAVRIGLGAAVSVAYAGAFGLEGTVRTVVVLEGAMPSAVLSYLLTRRAGAPSEFAAATVAVSTLAAAATIPLVAAVARG